MSSWSIENIRRQLAELARVGKGGQAVVQLVCTGDNFAPAECDVLDYKREAGDDDIALAEACRDVAAFYNMYGGFILVGVEEDDNEGFRLAGAATGYDVERVKNKVKDFTGERVLLTQEVCSLPKAGAGQVNVYVLRIPSRGSADQPLAFTKDGPAKGHRGRRVFDREEIPIREGDETTTARGAKVVEIWTARPHPLLGRSGRRAATPLLRVPHNLPDRNIICPHVVGRKEALDHLWRWLPDDLSRVKVLAGEGGIGKTSIAYEFADQVSLLEHQPFQQVVWLSAKARQFRPLTNSYDEMAETHFATYDELLDRICDFLAVTDEERADASRTKKLRLIKHGFELMPSLVVIDDIDSLSDGEQKQALELGFLLSGTKAKMLLTTRNNIIYSGDVCYTVRGLSKDEFPQFFDALMLRFPSVTRKTPKPAEVYRIWEASRGSPLFAESILRLLSYQTVGEAIGNWKGAAGDDVRRAALHREIMQLPPEARRILLTLALLSEASAAELSEVTSYDASRVAVAIQHLSSLFLVEAPRIGAENRIRVSETTGRLVLTIKRELAADHVHLEKAIRDFRTAAAEGRSKTGSRIIGAAILQASALERQGQVDQALETLRHTIGRVGKSRSADLLAYVGHLHLKGSSPDFDLSRKACREAFNQGCRKARLFETWFNSEWELGNFPGTEEVARAAIDSRVEPLYEWKIRLAAALSSKGHSQGGGRITVSVLPAYLESARELAEAIQVAPADEADRWRINLQDANDAIYRACLDAAAGATDKYALVRHLLEFIRLGDLRPENYKRVARLAREILNPGDASQRGGASLFAAAQSSLKELSSLIEERARLRPDDDEQRDLVAYASRASTPPFIEASHPSPVPQAGVPSPIQGDGAASLTLPDHLSSDRRSKFYVASAFQREIGIRFNGKERTDVKEYCISEGWIAVPSGKTLDRKGQPLLIKLKGRVEAFYK